LGTRALKRIALSVLIEPYRYLSRTVMRGSAKP
jgi:hypothetical protein